MSRLSPMSECGIRRLHANDRVMLAVDQALRHIGYPGFQTQAFLWLGGRVDAARLRAALAELSRRHPIVAARLVESRGAPCWQFRAGASLPLDLVELESDEEGAVLRHAGQLLGQRREPAQDDPVRFQLLRRPGGRDVLLLQYSHALMDNNATPFLLRELAHCTSSAPAKPPPTRAIDPLWSYVRRHPRERRRAAVNRAQQRLVASFASYQATMLGRPASRASDAAFGILTRTLDSAATNDLAVRTQQACGLPSLSMAILASVFRAIDRLASPGGRDNFAAGIGIDLGLRGPHGPIFQNLMSLVPIRASPQNLIDHGTLLRHLNRHMREALADDADLGMAALIGLFARRLHRAAWIAEATLRYSYSLWYAYFGAIDLGADFFEVPIEDIRYAGPCWAPMGVTLLANQFRGALRFQATYVPESVPEPLANAFLDEVLTDLAFA
jgi:hypothetical protein